MSAITIGDGLPIVDVIAGARPNFMKIAPILRAFDGNGEGGAAVRVRLIHTGQHYDARMSGDFFEQLGIRSPDHNFGVGSGTQAEQTAAIMVRYEALLRAERSQLCLVVGDVTSTMACAITAQKMGVSVAHVEGGLRSNDWSMPEEINRLVTDAVSNYFFTTSEYANANLRLAGVSADRIVFVGNTMIDTLLHSLSRLRQPEFWRPMNLAAGMYLVMTLHRPANVDDSDKLAALLRAVGKAAGSVRVVFPVHPRTANTLRGVGRLPENVALVEPLPYLEFNYLVRLAKGVITDSGGITEEATFMGVPCMTLRNSTERPETVALGTNELLGTEPSAVAPAMNRLLAGEWKRGSIPPMWDGQSGARIATKIRELLAQREI